MPPRDTEERHKTLPLDQTPVGRLLRWGKDHPGISSRIPKIDLEKWTLVVDGEIERLLKFTWGELIKLPKVESVSDFHCVEGWSVLDCRWEGVRFGVLEDLAGVKETVKAATFECADGYTTSLTLEELSGDDVALAYKLDGKDLEEGLGFPLRLVVPAKYAYKSAMWVMRIRFTREKEKGYWEVRGYSDTADIWKNDRYSF